MKVWISKYALTKGVYEIEVAHISNDGQSVFGNMWYDAFHGKGREWHETREEAVVRAERLRDETIANLEKKIEILRSMTF